ncbi:MAG TPA: signal recognition particle-docking protein FtsY [Terriglobia bacterium]|nr:signal recognition particle-docking protein FtsY [Terriglobia bacterium]
MVQTLFGPADNKPGLLDRLKKAVASTKAQLVGRIEEIVEGKETIDRSVLDDLEATLIVADLGVKTTGEILTHLQEQMNRRALQTTQQLRPAIEREILRILENPAASQGTSSRARSPGRPTQGLPEVIFVVGVNGVGKTTSIAKLANYFLQQGRQPLLCAADTFRAAANEQLEIWAERLGIEIVKQKPGADPSAVIFDALAAAKTRHKDPVIVDTAGRLHTKFNLMTELEKMCRIAGREVAHAPHQVLLVIDGTTGQNGLQQARQFTEHAGTTGIILTKLDGTAKGGVVVAIARELGLPIQFVGVGEKIDDLLPFDPGQFVASLFES